MKLKKQQYEYKWWLRIQRRIEFLEKELRKRPLIELKEPYQNGWIIYLDFRDDIKRRKDYPELKEVFDIVATTDRTNDVKRIQYIRKNRSLVNHMYVRKKQTFTIGFISLHPKYFEKKVPDRLKKHFYKTTEFNRGTSKEVYRHNMPTYWFVVKTKPYIITHAYQKGGDIEKEIAYLEKIQRDLGLKFWRNYSSSYPAYKDRTKVRDKIQKFLKGETEDITNDKIPKEYDW